MDRVEDVSLYTSMRDMVMGSATKRYAQSPCPKCVERWYPELYPELADRYPELYKEKA